MARRALELAGENPTYYRELLNRVEGKVGYPEKPLIQDNRTLNILVIDEETKDLINRVGERTRQLNVANNIGKEVKDYAIQEG